jgi:hypothetical protein
MMSVYSVGIVLECVLVFDATTDLVTTIAAHATTNSTATATSGHWYY